MTSDDRSARTTPTTGTRIPRPLRPLVRWLLRRTAVHGRVVIGRGVRIGRGAKVSATHGLVIGREVSIGPGSVVQVNGKIGDYALIARGVYIVGRDDHDTQTVGRPIAYGTWIGERDLGPRDLVELGVDVWVGAGSVILSGVKVGDGAIVAAGAVVTRDIPSGAVVGGNPASFLSWRFASSEQLGEHLERLGVVVDRD